MNDNVTQGKLPEPRVSVVIPLYNHEQYIEAAIQSVLSQTVPAAEIIVIDDGSTDSSAAKVRELCKKHPQIIFWSWPNQGAHHTLNAGILRATGDFVAILNSDDCYDPERLAACLAVVRADPSVDVVASVATFIDGQGKSALNPWYDDALAFYKQENDIALALFHANFLVTTSNLFIRRSVFDSTGLFAPLRYAHDLEWSLRLILGKKHIQLIDRPLLAYRLHAKNTISENKLQEEIERAAVFAYFLYRQWCAQGAVGTLSGSLERYLEVLSQQDILEIVKDFLGVLNAKPEPQAIALTKSLSTEFQGLLSRLGVSWGRQQSADVLLNRFEAAAKVNLRRRKEARDIAQLQADIEWLQQQCESWEKALQTMRAGNTWLVEQRNAWESAVNEQAKSHAQALDELRLGHTWLLEQRDAWELTAKEQAKSQAQAMDELRTGNTWLLEQRDAWEQAAQSHELQASSLTQALQEMHNANTWLLEQRNAWAQVAERSGEELAQSRAALDGLLRKPLFRLLVRVKLLELTYVPPGAVAPG